MTCFSCLWNEASRTFKIIQETPPLTFLLEMAGLNQRVEPFYRPDTWTDCSDLTQEIRITEVYA